MTPYEIPACAGKPYTPSNGTEGMMFQERFCGRCSVDQFDHDTGEGEQCRILLDELSGKQRPEWTHDERGRPVCTAFVRRLP